MPRLPRLLGPGYAALLGVVAGLALAKRDPPRPVYVALSYVELELPSGEEAEEVKPSEPEVTKNVLEPLTRDVLVARTIESFPTGYLTLIAIIQGVALALLLDKALPVLLAPAPRPLFPGLTPVTFHFLVGGESAAGFTGVLVTTYMYLWFTTVMRWVPTFLDTFIPYILGVAEIVPFYLLQQYGRWWVAMAALGLTGAIAFTHTILRIDKNAFGEKVKAYKYSKWMLLGLVAFTLIWVACSSFMYRAVLRSREVSSLTRLAPWGCLLIGTAMIALSEILLRAIYRKYDL